MRVVFDSISRFFSRLAFIFICIVLPFSNSFAGLTVGTAVTHPLRSVTESENFSIGVDELGSSLISEGRLLELGLDLSTFTSPLSRYELDYLQSILSRDATDVSEWQADISSRGTQDAAQWKLQRFSDAVDDIAGMTHEIIDTAVSGSYSSEDIITARGETLATIQAFWPTAIIDPTSPESIKTFLATNSVLSSTTFASSREADAYIANSGGSSFDLTSFRSCYSNSDSISGGAENCSMSDGDWTSLNTLQVAAANDNFANITKYHLDTVFNADNSNYTIDLTDDTNLQYTQNCIAEANSNAWIDIKNCVTSATSQVAAKWKIYQISLGHDEITHPTSHLTISLYDRAVSAAGSPFLQNVLNAKPSYNLNNLRKHLEEYFRAQRLTDQSSDERFKLFPVNKVGFKDGLDSYNAWLSNSGFSTTALEQADHEVDDIVQAWEACRRSHDPTSGGRFVCMPSYSVWSAHATTRAAANIVQVRHNDFAGPRVYFETLMGEHINIQNFATANSTEFGWRDDNQNKDVTARVGWISSSGTYGFLNIDAPNSPQIGALVRRL
jgi:hypothetical protein